MLQKTKVKKIFSKHKVQLPDETFKLLENEVIKLEDRSNNKYKDLSGENLIMATMAQSIFMKESE